MTLEQLINELIKLRDSLNRRSTPGDTHDVLVCGQSVTTDDIVIMFTRRGFLVDIGRCPY